MLQGVRVLDFTRLLPGPYATLRLADLGAEVMKVEESSGDPARYMGGEPRKAGTGPVFLANNRNKRSIVLDLKSPLGRDKARALATTADVVIESFRPGVADHLGIGYEDLREQRSDIVYCSLTGYGQTGDLRHVAGHDLNYMARSGLLSTLTDGNAKPIVPMMQFADFIGGIVASEAILAALVQRERTGKGAHLDISMTHALMGMLTNHALVLGKNQGDGLDLLSGKVVCYRLYQTSDGRHISLAALEPKFWQAFCQYFNRPDWIPSHMSEATAGNSTFEDVRALFASHDFSWWVEVCNQLDGCVAPVLSVSEALASPLAVSSRAVFTLDTPDYGSLLQVRTHAGGRGATNMKATPPPKLGDWQREANLRGPLSSDVEPTTW